MAPRKDKKIPTPTPEELQALYDLPSEGFQDEETEMQALTIETALLILAEEASEGSESARKKFEELVQKLKSAEEAVIAAQA